LLHKENSKFAKNNNMLIKYNKPYLTLLSLILFFSAFFIKGTLKDDILTISAFTFAFLFVSLDFKLITGNLQIILIFLYGITIGVFMDIAFSEFGFYTSIFTTVAVFTVLRQVFMPQMTYINWIWVEPLFLVIATFLFFYYGLLTKELFEINLYNISFLAFSPAYTIVGGYVQDSFQIKKKVRFGYKVKVGDIAPDFKLINQFDQPFGLHENLGEKNFMLIFVRGDWCPACHIMLRTYNKYSDKFKEKNVFVVAIGPDNIDVNKNMVEKLGIGYELLSDTNQKTSDMYGVIYENSIIEEFQANYDKGIPLPASFLIGKDGKVIYVSRPEKVGEFLNPNQIGSILDDLKA
jgi:peroxiredoxin